MAKHALSLFDEGMALSYVIDHVLSDAGERQRDVGATLIKGALTMPDKSRHGVCTPIKKEIGPGCVEVGDTIITIIGSPCEGYQGENHARILLWFEGGCPAGVRDHAPDTSCYQLSHWVAQIVTLRAVGSDPAVREWLAAVLA